MQKKFCSKKHMQKGIIILFWLCVWQLAAVLSHNDILLVGPIQVGAAFLENIAGADFWLIVLHSFGRIGAGFLCALFFGLLSGALSYRYALLEDMLSPVITTSKSIPVASFVVLLLIWFGSARLSFFISFLIVFPNVYVNTIAGLKSTDRQLVEMAQVFGMPGWNRFCYLYRPALMPYLTSCLKISLGMSWKSGVAAEVIGMPEYSLGERIYMSKIYLDTAGLFAWTLTVVLLSFLFEKAVLFLTGRFAMWRPRQFRAGAGRRGDSIDGAGKSAGKPDRKTDEAGSAPDKENAACADILISHVGKAYGEQRILRDFSYALKAGSRYCLMAPSGSGKTTLLRLISHMEQADTGEIAGAPKRVGMVFQEDRLCEEYDAVTNIMLTIKPKAAGSGKRGGKEAVFLYEAVRKEAARILPQDCLTKPVSELSGGMKRRCTILRAMLSGAEFIIMDEPFTGLDEDNRQKTAAYIMEKLQGRTLLVTTHRGEDAELLAAERIRLLAD